MSHTTFSEQLVCSCTSFNVLRTSFRVASLALLSCVGGLVWCRSSCAGVYQLAFQGDGRTKELY